MEAASVLGEDQKSTSEPGVVSQVGPSPVHPLPISLSQERMAELPRQVDQLTDGAAEAVVPLQRLWAVSNW